jgi:excisionase family DNA binding protein
MNSTQIAARVKSRRRELKLSQAEVADRMTKAGFAWHQTTVAKVESQPAPRPLTLEEGFALVSVLELDRVEDLLSRGDDRKQAAVLRWTFEETGGRWNTEPAPRVVPDPRERPWLTVAELAEITGEGEKAIRAAVAAGHLPSLNIGRYVRIPTAAFLRLCGISERDEKDPRQSSGEDDGAECSGIYSTGGAVPDHAIS